MTKYSLWPYKQKKIAAMCSTSVAVNAVVLGFTTIGLLRLR
jgi:hypothetical protein